MYGQIHSQLWEERVQIDIQSITFLFIPPYLLDLFNKFFIFALPKKKVGKKKVKRMPFSRVEARW